MTLSAAHPIQFWHQNAVRTVDSASAGRSVLNYLRRDCGLTGTKEGCAEGDCGACCVMTVAQSETGLVFESVNACIHPVANLHGKALLSVEDLGTPAVPHPVQHEMVQAHASQCGFCTPGFVVSLAACTEQARCDNTRVNREQVLDAISGNLCRCTGYKPIVQAGLFAAQSTAGLDHRAIAAGLAQLSYAAPAAHASQASQASQAKNVPQAAQTLPEAPAILTPRSIAELNAAIAAHPQAVLTAGLTDVGLWLNKQLRDIPLMLSTVQVAEFLGIHHTVAGMDIGAAVTLTQLAPHLLAEYPELHEWHERFASLPIRNAATLGGNVVGGSPIGDSMPVLLALDAQLLLQRGEMQRTVALKDFYLGYQKKDLQAGEFLRRILIPKRSQGSTALKLAVYKISKRFEDDISAVCAALAFEVEGGVIATARLGFGGVAATPVRASSVEAAVQGQAFTPATLESAATLLEAAFTPLSDHRASAKYRRLMCGNALRRAAAQWFGDEPTRVFAGVEGAA
jgi:xanthine dehydrogenase small subunit